jgi:hypothetical protein
MNSSAEHEIINLSKQKWDWMSAQDVAPLGALFKSRPCSSTWARPSRRSKSSTSSRPDASTIATWTSGRLGPVHRKHRHRAHHTSARIRGGWERSLEPFIVTEVYVQQADAWTLASMSFTRLVTH